MVWENPFLIREIRQLFRRKHPLQVWASCTGLGVALFVYLLYQIGPPPARPGSWPVASLITLLPCHAVLCIMAGLYSSNRVFAEEHRSSTLEGLFLLPDSPARWLLAKLLFPILVVGLTWGAALPLYLLVVTLELASLDVVLQASLPVLLAGWMVIPIILLLPPDYRERLQRLEVHTGGPAPHLDRDMQFRLLLLALAFAALLRFTAPRLFGVNGKPGWLPLAGTWVPEWVVWLLAGLPVLLAAGLTALATASRQQPDERRAAWARGVAAVCLYALLAASFWPKEPWARLLLLVLPFVASVLLTRVAQQREDPHASAEIERISQRWDSALLIRDLRVYNRLASIPRGLLSKGLPAALLLLGQAVLISWAFARQPTWTLHPVAGIIGAAIALPVLLLPATQASQSWLKERRAETLQLLLLTPLEPREMIRARLLAGTLYYGAIYTPVLLVLIAVAATPNAWGIGPMLLALTPLWYAGVLAVETAERPESPAPLGSEVTVASGLLILGSAVCAFAALGLGASVVGGLPPWSAWGLALLIALIGAGIGWLAVRLRAEQLRGLREGGLEEAIQPLKASKPATAGN